MLKPGAKCGQHRAGVSGFRIESIPALRVRLHFRIYIPARDRPELGKKTTRCCHAAVSKSVVGIGLSELSQLHEGGVQCFRRLWVNQKASSQLPGICVKIWSRGAHGTLRFRQLEPE